MKGSVVAIVLAALVAVGITHSSAVASITKSISVDILEAPGGTDDATAAVGDTILVTVTTRSSGNANEGDPAFEVTGDTLYVRIEKTAGNFLPVGKFLMKEDVVSDTTFKMYYVVADEDSCDITGFIVQVYDITAVGVDYEIETTLNIDGIRPRIEGTPDTVVTIGDKVGPDTSVAIGDTLYFDFGKASEKDVSLTIGIATEDRTVISTLGTFSTEVGSWPDATLSGSYVVTLGDTTLREILAWAFLKDPAGNLGGTVTATTWDTLWTGPYTVLMDGEPPEVSGRVYADAIVDSARFRDYWITNEEMIWFEKVTELGIENLDKDYDVIIRATPSDTTYLGHTVTGATTVDTTISDLTGTDMVEVNFSGLRDSVAYNIAYMLRDWAGNESAWDSLANVRYDVSKPLLSVFPRREDTSAGPINYGHVDTLNDTNNDVIISWSEPCDTVYIQYRAAEDGEKVAKDSLIYEYGFSLSTAKDKYGTTFERSVGAFPEDSLKYELIVYARDLAGNDTTWVDTFYYKEVYVPPALAMFKVDLSADTVHAGEGITVTVTAKDTVGGVERLVPTFKDTVTVTLSGAGTGITWSGDATVDPAAPLVAYIYPDKWTAGVAEFTVVDTVIDVPAAPEVVSMTVARGTVTGTDTLTWIPAACAKYIVDAPDTVYTDSSFVVTVRPADKYGNDMLPDSIDVWVELSANKAGTQFPLGRQHLVEVPGEFPVIAPSIATDNLMIYATTAAPSAKWTAITGVKKIVVLTAPVVPPVAELDAPDSVWVEPLGGQGTFVRVSWILSRDNPGLGGNDMAVEYAVAAYDLGGNLKYQAVVPALYFPANVPPTNIGTVVFYTWEDTDSLRYYVWAQNRGIPLASAAYSVPKKAYRKLADGSVLVIPEKVAGAAKSTPVLRSAAAVSEPVAAYDGVPPAPVAWVKAVDTPADEGGKITVSWTASPDDKMFEVWGYPVRGITGYRIYRKALGEEEFQLAGTAPAGATTFVDEVGVNNRTYIYKVFAADASNEVESEVEERAFAAANVGVPVGDFTSDGRVDFDDFFAFIDAFGTTSGQVEFDALFDLTSDGRVDFDDFFAFVDHFGETGVAKQVPVVLGVNTAARLLAQVKEDRSDLVIDAAVEGVSEAKGCGFVLKYDPRAYEFVRAEASTELPMLVKDEGGELAFAYAVGRPTSEALKVRFYFRPKDELGGAIHILRAIVADPFNRLNPVEVLRQTLVAPKAFALGQNRPNPFNPTTVIEYVLPESAPVKLEVYNLLGQVVRTLVDGEQVAGRYSVVWDGRDDLGREVATGIYFYRLSAGKFHAVRRMALVR